MWNSSSIVLRCILPTILNWTHPISICTLWWLLFRPIVKNPGYTIYLGFDDHFSLRWWIRCKQDFASGLKIDGYSRIVEAVWLFMCTRNESSLKISQSCGCVSTPEKQKHGQNKFASTGWWRFKPASSELDISPIKGLQDRAINSTPAKFDIAPAKIMVGRIITFLLKW